MQGGAKVSLPCPYIYTELALRLDAVEDLMDHPTFESDFMQMVKGLPDLERIVSRVHANSCKIKDFLKLLAVRSVTL